MMTGQTGQDEVVGDRLRQQIDSQKAQTNGTPPEDDQDADCLVFREERVTKRVKITSGTDLPRYFVLREMTGAGVEQWMKFTTIRVMSGKRGRPDPKEMDFKDYMATLISMCLFEEDGETPVPITVVRGWPASTLNGLYDYCETMNGLNEEGKEQAKKA